MSTRTITLALALVSLLGCSETKRRTVVTTAPGATGSASTGATGSSTTPGATPPRGPLAQKAHAFETVMGQWHLGLGQVQDIRLGPSGPERMGNAPSRCLWTGVYAGSQAMRYRVTQEPEALTRLTQALQTLHDLQEITGLPGVVARGFDEPAIETHGWQGSGRLSQYNHNKGETSRDQYAGWFYGIALGYDLIQDPVLRQQLSDDVAAVCDKLIADDLALKTPWGPQGTVETFFNLKPDDFYQDDINAQTWATVDDFPANLITKSVPYSQTLADAIKQAQIPPVRAGEALRAIFFFTVAERVTGDAKYGDFKRQLLFQRGYLQVLHDYLTFQDDLFYGRNQQVVQASLRMIFQALGQIFSAYLTATGKSAIVSQVLVPVAAAGLSTWLARVITDGLAWLQNPNNAASIQKLVAQGRIAVMVLNLVGQQKLATQLDQILNNYAQHLSQQGLIDFSRTVRSHLGANLTIMPLMAMIRLEQDPQLVDSYRQLLEQKWSYLATDHNPIVNLVHAGYGVAPGADDVSHSVLALQNFPVDMGLREVDNSNWPGLVVSPWPDRFGRVGNIALEPDHFPINHRPPDIFSWRGHPRTIKSGSNNPAHKVAPLGYLAPYWMARELGYLTDAD